MRSDSLGSAASGASSAGIIAAGSSGARASGLSRGFAVSAVRLWSIGVVLAALCIGLVGVPRAQAATAGTTYVYSPLNSATNPEGQSFSMVLGAPFAGGIAVLPGSGDIMVADQDNGILAFTPDPVFGGDFYNIFECCGGTADAVDPVTDDLYVAGQSTISRLNSDGSSPPNYSADGSFTLAPGAVSDLSGGMAVDPVTQDLLVIDPTAGRVVRISHTTGAVIGSFDGSSAPEGALVRPGQPGGADVTPARLGASIAVAPDRSIYVVDQARILHFDANGNYLNSLPISGWGQGVAVNAATGEVAVETGAVLGTTPISVYGFTSAGTPTFQVPFPALESDDNARGLAWDPVMGRIYAPVNERENVGQPQDVLSFVGVPAPGVDAPTVSAIQKTSAHVTTDVATGSAPAGDTQARFEYCDASDDCGDYPVSDPTDPSNPWHRGSADQVVTGPSGPNGTPVEDDLTGLSPNTTYEVRAVAYNSNASINSDVTSFTTLTSAPAVVTGAAGAVTQTTAQLQGTINPFGLATTYHFEYGLGTDYGASVPLTDATAFNGTAPRTFVRTVEGLSAGTTYHFRLVATNAVGTSYGADQTFTTAGSVVRAYEQVTPVEKEGETLNTVFGFQAEGDGDGIEYSLESGRAGIVGAPQFLRDLSTRGGDDWNSGVALDPPTSVVDKFVSSTTLAVSSDFTRTFVASNRALAPGGTDGAANLYVVDVATGAYTFVGSSTDPNAFGAMVSLNQSNMFLAGASDFSWVDFVSQSSLLPGVSHSALYRWSASGGLELLSRLPDGSIPSSSVGLQSQTIPATRLVSDDGSRAYFTLNGGSDSGVYLREGSTTTAISVSHVSGGPAGPQPGGLAGVSRDGRYAIFTAGQLTADAPSGVTDLYQYDAVTGALRYLGTTDGLLEDVLAVSDDAQTVYFNGAGMQVWRDGTLSSVGHSAIAPLSTFISPSGRYMAFDGGSGGGFSDVYLYDADAQSLVCVTCVNGIAAGEQHAGLPSATRNISNRVPAAVNDAGEVFFTTDASLLAADRNGVSDVYMYQDGQVTLISPGVGDFPASFADSSDNGSDVFFTTAESLVGRDTDGEQDIYDARLGGGLPAQSPLPSPPDCVGSECKEPSGGVTVSPFVIASQATSPSTKSAAVSVRGKVALVGVSFTAKAMDLRIRISQEGRAKVTGAFVVSTSRAFAKAGTYSIVVPLSGKARLLRRAHRKFKVAVKVTVTGGWGTATADISRTIGK